MYRHIIFTSCLRLGSLGNGHWDQGCHVGSLLGTFGLNTFGKVKKGHSWGGDELWCSPVVTSSHPRGCLGAGRTPQTCSAYPRVPVFILLYSLPLPMRSVTLGESALLAATPKEIQLRSFSQPTHLADVEINTRFLKGWIWVAHHSIHYPCTNLFILF